MSAPFLFILFIGLLAGTILSMSRHTKAVHPDAINVARPRTNALPHLRRLDFFTTAERSFYEILRRLTPNHTVFAKVRLADLVFIPGKLERKQFVNQLDGKQVDFVVCDKSLAPVVAIKLDGNPGAASNSLNRDKFVEEVLAAAAVPVVRFGGYRPFILEDIHQLIAPYLRLGTPFV